MRITSIPQLARNVNRLREVLTILSKYGLADWVHRLDLRFAQGLFKSRDGAGLASVRHEERIRLALVDLGTTFIKLGQMLSTRPDLVGHALATELTALQDATPADPPEVVRATIQAELHRPVEQLFTEFDAQPLASASIAQVHRARLPDGTPVVVKVQHARLTERVRVDLDILLGLAELAEHYLPELRPYRPRATAGDFQRLLLRELDFHREERHLLEFQTHFAGDAAVRFPRPYAEWSTGRVLTMDYFEGVKLSDTARLQAAGHDLDELARRGARVFLDMIFRDGFYHADPHPGNLLVLPGGALGMLDCGMVGRIDERLREEIEDLLLGLAEHDSDRVAGVLMRVGSVPPEVSVAELCADLSDFVGFYSGQPLDQLDLSAALTEMTAIVRRHQIALPPGLALLLKVLVMLEGTSRLLNPVFNLSELLKPYQRKLLWRRLSPRRQAARLLRSFREWERLVEQLPRGVGDLLQQLRSGKFDLHVAHKHLEPTLNRLAFGLLTSSLFLGSALLWSQRVPPLLNEVSLPGAVGTITSVVLGLRLLLAIKRSGRLDE